MNDESLNGFAPFEWHDAFLMLEYGYFILSQMNKSTVSFRIISAHNQIKLA